MLASIHAASQRLFVIFGEYLLADLDILGISLLLRGAGVDLLPLVVLCLAL